MTDSRPLTASTTPVASAAKPLAPGDLAPRSADRIAGNPVPQVAHSLLTVSGLGAFGGALIGSVLLAALQVGAPGGFHWYIDIPFGIMFGGTFGAAVGAVAAPLLTWFLFPHVPLGRAMLCTGAGTVAGAGVGLGLAGTPVVGACLGFLFAGVALRFHPDPSRLPLAAARAAAPTAAPLAGLRRPRARALRLGPLLGLLALLATGLAWTWARLWPGPAVQAALDEYAPGLPLGRSVPRAAHARYELRVAPYLGYRDGSYVAPGGLRDLGVQVDEHVGDAARAVSHHARIVAVQLHSPDAAHTAAVEARLAARFGPPETRCYATGAMAGAVRWRSAYWPGRAGRGVELLVSRGVVTGARPPGGEAGPPAGVGFVTFGRERPALRYVQPEPCG